MEDEQSWDFFISYPGPDKQLAFELYNILIPPTDRVFFDSMGLAAGDNWKKRLPYILSRSKIVVALITVNTDSEDDKKKTAYWQQEEIAYSIELLQADKHTKKIVPIYVGDRRFGLPYFGLTTSVKEKITDISEIYRLKPWLEKLRTQAQHWESEKANEISKQVQIAERISNARGLGELKQITLAVLKQFPLFAPILYFTCTLSMLMCLAAAFYSKLQLIPVAVLLVGSTWGIVELYKSTLRYNENILTKDINPM